MLSLALKIFPVSKKKYLFSNTDKMFSKYLGPFCEISNFILFCNGNSKDKVNQLNSRYLTIEDFESRII